MDDRVRFAQHHFRSTQPKVYSHLDKAFIDGCWPSMPALRRPLSLCSVGGRKIINHFVVKVAFREIGASICHDFVTRNLKYRDQHNHSWTLNRTLVKQRVNFDTLRGESIHPKSSPPSVLIGVQFRTRLDSRPSRPSGP